tara:strand:+ start:75 stop:377 length:303 start_codon:yes stop_codon:yes gene_type:complete
MPQITIVYWRDIPAQVIVGKGRKSAKKALNKRFEQAIDRAAMKAGMVGTDEYLSEWRKDTSSEIQGLSEELLKKEIYRLEEEFDNQKIKKLVDNHGWADP